jgi:hypothetical protein
LILLGAAAVFDLAALVALFEVPFGTVTTGSSDGPTVVTHPTLVETNGTGIAWIVVASLLVPCVLAVSFLLRRKPGAGVVAWALGSALAVMCVLGLLSIGLFMAPAAAAVLFACALQESTSTRRALDWRPDPGSGDQWLPGRNP